MSSDVKIRPTDWLAGPLLGAVIGAVFLGVGGRVSMRLIALAAGQPPGFSVGGTLTVIGIGALCGAVGGLLFVLVRRLFPARRVLRAMLFWAVCVLVTLRGLQPVSLLRVALFVPLVGLFGAALQLFWCRVYLPRREALRS